MPKTVREQFEEAVKEYADRMRKKEQEEKEWLRRNTRLWMDE